jgi:hypothetical protein
MSTVTHPRQEEIVQGEQLFTEVQQRVIDQFNECPEAYHSPAHRMDQQFPELAKAISAKHKVEDWLWLAVHHNECRITFEELKESIA